MIGELMGKQLEIKFTRYERRIVAPVIERYEMTSLSHSPRDRILWILVNNGGTMERSRLRASTGMRYALLNPIFKELAREAELN